MINWRYLLLLFMILPIVYVYQYRYCNAKIEKVNAQVRQSQIENLYSEKILGKDIRKIPLRPYFGNYDESGINNSIIVYANLTGCGKCIDHHLKLASTLADQNKLVYVFYAYTKAQIRQTTQIYNITKKVLWDQNDEISKIIQADTRKINPFILVNYNGKAIMVKFSYENDFNYLNESLNLLRKMVI